MVLASKVIGDNMPRQQIDQTVVDMILALHNDGLTTQQIATELDVSAPTVYKYLKEHDLTPNKKTRSIDNIDFDKLLEMYENPDIPVLSICSELGISQTNFYLTLHRASIPLRSIDSEAADAAQKQLEHALHLYEHNKEMTVHAICLECGISQPTLHREVRNRKIPFRSPARAGKRENWKEQIENA